ncbi:MAG: hypothetical protein ACR2IP_07755 [Solirubrobacteraceae bacterium]
MRARATLSLRTLAFGDLDTAIWGAVWSQDDARPAVLSLGSGAGVLTREVSIDGSGEDAAWRLVGDGVDLTFTPRTGVALAPLAGAATAGFEQLGEIDGRFAIGADEHELHACPGRRGTRVAKVGLERLESVREVSAWFGADEALALLALRPRGAAGHEQDLLGAALLDCGAAVTLADPRLSTTYDAAGLPARASIELWLGEPEGEQYPRRAAGEVVEPQATLLDPRGGGGDPRAEDSVPPGKRSDPALELHTALWRWRSGGREGAGVYMLALFG